MSLQNFPSFTFANSVTYLPAQLKEYGSDWRIEYYCINPQTERLERKQIKVNRIIKRFSSKKEARRYCQDLILHINTKLISGWNPFLQEENSNLYVTLKDACDHFLRSKSKELRENSMRSYNSFVVIFTKWVDKINPKMYASTFNHILAMKYMDYVFEERNLNANSYNNQLKLANSVFNWFLERNYIKENPFATIKRKKKQDKQRILIPNETRQSISTFLTDENPQFLIVLELIFTSLIRPKEINMIRLEHIHLDKGFITIPADNAKNHHERYSTLSMSLIDKLKKLNLERFPKTYYLFGSDLQPSKKPCHQGLFRKHWYKVQKELKLPKEMQLYSFRDSGITYMLQNGIPALTVMQHADHSDLSITTRYARHADPNLIKTIKENAPDF